MTGMAENGQARSSQWERYSPTMHRLLAESMFESTPHVVAGGVSSTFGIDPMADWTAYLSTGTSFDETPETPVTPVASLAVLSSVASALSQSRQFCCSLFATGLDDQVFIAPRAIDYDNPTFDQAVDPSNPDRTSWCEACQKELNNMSDHSVPATT